MILQLNLPALERLLGGDSEIEVQLRHQIVQQFTKKHLLQVIKDPLIQKLKTEMEKEIEQYVGKEVWSSGYGFTIHIQERIKELIRKASEVEIKKFVSETFAQLAKERAIETKTLLDRYEMKLIGEANSRIKQTIDAIETGLDKRLDEAFERRVSQEISRRLEAAKNMPPQGD